VVYQLLKALGELPKDLRAQHIPAPESAAVPGRSAPAASRGVPAATTSSRPATSRSSFIPILLQLEPVLLYQVLPAALQSLCLLPPAPSGFTSLSDQTSPRTPLAPHLNLDGTPLRTHSITPQSPEHQKASSTKSRKPAAGAQSCQAGQLLGQSDLHGPDVQTACTSTSSKVSSSAAGGASAQSAYAKDIDRYLKAHNDARAVLGLLPGCLRDDVGEEVQRVVAEVVTGTWKGAPRLQSQAAGGSITETAAVTGGSGGGKGKAAVGAGHLVSANAANGGAKVGREGTPLLAKLTVLLKLGLPLPSKKKGLTATPGAAVSPCPSKAGTPVPGTGSWHGLCLDAASEAALALSGLDTWGLLVQLLGQQFTGTLGQHMLNVSAAQGGGGRWGVGLLVSMELTRLHSL
jgi:hypothetical protein